MKYAVASVYDTTGAVIGHLHTKDRIVTSFTTLDGTPAALFSDFIEEGAEIRMVAERARAYSFTPIPDPSDDADSTTSEAEPPTAGMGAYLLTYNPTLWEWDGRDEILAHVASGPGSSGPSRSRRAPCRCAYG